MERRRLEFLYKNNQKKTETIVVENTTAKVDIKLGNGKCKA